MNVSVGGWNSVLTITSDSLLHIHISIHPQPNPESHNSSTSSPNPQYRANLKPDALNPTP